MFITKEMLLARGACKEGVTFFEHHFPTGAELADIMATRHIPASMLHWGYDNLEVSDEEKEAYFKLLRIIDSVYVSHSENVSKSKVVSKSSDVSDSAHIFNSTDIHSSYEVVNSNSVENSHGVFNSTLIYDSSEVINSTSINNSTNIVNAEYVVNSQSIIQSKLITNSQIIRNSENLTDCLFCADCKNLKRSLFCCNQEEENEFLLFNHKIEEIHYHNIIKMFQRISNVKLLLFDNYPKEFLTNITPKIHNNISTNFSLLPQKFIKWVMTLPNYNPRIMYELTYLPVFFK